MGWLVLLCGAALLALRQLIHAKTPALPVVRVILPRTPRMGVDAREVISSPSVLVAAELPSRAPPLAVALQAVRELPISVGKRTG